MISGDNRRVSPSTASAPTAADLVDWDAAVRLARLAVPAGPRVPTATRRATVALLHRSIVGATPWAGRITGLPDAARHAAATAEVLVVDRTGLMTASAAWLRGLMRNMEDMGDIAAPDVGRGARALATAQVGAVLGYMSTRLLGQVLPPLGVSAGTRPGARLLLVAPNVLAIRQRLDLDVLDLPAWITLHEATHLIQLSAAPWLAEHLAAQLGGVVRGLVEASRRTASGGADRCARLARAAAHARSADGRPSEPAALLLGGLLEPSERAALARVAALLTLLEGHAEAVLDAVDPSRMPSVHRLRAVLARTRRDAGDAGGVGPGSGSGSLLHHMIGMEAKEAQYADGAAFVRAVVARVGHAGLNAVWAAPDRLPRPGELARPDQWIERLGL